MRYTNQVRGLIVGLLLISGGVAAFLLIPCFGWVAGPLLVVLGLIQGAKGVNVWRWKTCKVLISTGQCDGEVSA